MHPNGLFNNGALKNRLIDQGKSRAKFNERDAWRRSFSGECRGIDAMMPVKGMIEFRTVGVPVLFLCGIDVKVRVYFAAVFGFVGMEEGLVHLPDQKAGDAISHGYHAAHRDILSAAPGQVNKRNSEENFRVYCVYSMHSLAFGYVLG